MLHFFTDPILRAPTLGSMLVGLVAALVGVLIFVKKRSLLGETLSHATYPGVTFSLVISGIFSLESMLPVIVLIGAFLSAILGFFTIEYMEKKLRVSADSALTAVLALFFGIGITIASYAQNSFAHLFRQTQAYLYGQAATMTDIHLFIYAFFALLVIVFIALFYKEILALSFDPQFAQATGMRCQILKPAIFILITLALVIGIRCVGVILMSAMLIAPAVAARQFTNRLISMFFLAGIFGTLSGFLGIYCSVTLSEKWIGHYAIPSGPMIVLMSGSFALYALFFAPKRGLFIRYLRVVKFRILCIQENLVKALWRRIHNGKSPPSLYEIKDQLGFTSWFIPLILLRLKHQDLIEKKDKHYHLTSLGLKRGARIVRLHRLWEVYLVNSLGLKIERVHKSAEEMEHILTPALEKKLTELLDNPQQDPHDQPIPAPEESYCD